VHFWNAFDYNEILGPEQPRIRSGGSSQGSRIGASPHNRSRL
jgi:hypothetical protein